MIAELTILRRLGYAWMAAQQKKKRKQLALIMKYFAHSKVAVRGKKIYRKRWDEGYLLNLALGEDSFKSEYRMEAESFHSLLRLLENKLQVNQEMAALSTHSCESAGISVASRLGQALILLGGGRIIEVMRTHGVSQTFARKNFERVLDAINNCKELDFQSPNDPVSLAERAAGFESRSYGGLFKHCVGAIDGIAIEIQAPRSDDVDAGKNQKRYFSGSKLKYCLNVQAVCDSQCRFIALTCKHVGSTNDIVAFERSSLRALCKSLPLPYHWVGDAAYVNSRGMIVPFEGTKLSEEEDAFNFYQSQVRITIERAFGMLISKFGIFWKPLQFRLKLITKIIQACGRIHNYCINNGVGCCPMGSTLPPAELQLRQDGTLPEPVYVNGAADAIDLEDDINVGNPLRAIILQDIAVNGYKRM